PRHSCSTTVASARV
ncbi:hypothetical protein EC950183_4717, partial [Escherichia coli 95.0183]